MTNLELICNEVAKAADMTPDELRGRCRKQRFNRARIGFVLRVRAYTDYSLEEIGAFLGRDHSTISHLQRRGANWGA